MSFLVSNISIMDENQENRITMTHVVLRHEVDEPEPPPRGLTSNFKTVEEWLSNVCDENRPIKPNDAFRVGLFESADDYIVFIVGLNTHGPKEHLITDIDFEPSNMYFRLPENEYQNLTRQELLNKLGAQLFDFIKTDKFRNSFLAEAKSITADFMHELWTK